jgi:hypothetical protein
MIAAALSGGLATHQIPADPEFETGISQTFVAINLPTVAHDGFAESLANQIVDNLHGPMAEGVRYPGEQTLRTLDRRWIFLLMGILVLEPLLFPLSLPLRVTPPVQGFVNAVDSIPKGSTVLMSCDYDPGAIPELVPMTVTAFRHLMSRDCKVVVTCLWSGGAGLVDSVITETSREFPDKHYGVDWVDLGYKSGNEAVMVLMGQGVVNVYPRDYRGNETRSLPIGPRAT